MIRWSIILITLAATVLAIAQDAGTDEALRLRAENAELRQQVAELQKELARLQPPPNAAPASAPTSGVAGMFGSEADIFAGFPQDHVPLGPVGWNQLQCGVANQWLTKNINGRMWRGPVTLMGVEKRKFPAAPGQPVSAGADYIQLVLRLEPTGRKKQLDALEVKATAECDVSQTAMIVRLLPDDRVTLEGRIKSFAVLESIGGLSFIMKLTDAHVISVAKYPKHAPEPLRPPY